MDIRSLIEPGDSSARRPASDQSPAKQPVPPPQNRASGTWNDLRAPRSLPNDARRPSLPPPSPGHPLPNPSLQSSVNTTPHASFYQNHDTPRLESPIEQLRSPSLNFQRTSTLASDHRSSLGTPTQIGHRTSIPLPQTPTGSTPGSAGAFSGFHRPTSSHSASTPTSAHIPNQSSSQTSPQAPGPHGGVFPQVPFHQISPRLSTQLGPPPVRSRQSLDSQHSSPHSASHKRSVSGELRSNFGSNPSVSPSQSASKNYLNQNVINRYERQQSISVSPKTQAAGLPSSESAVGFDRSPGLSHEQAINRRPYDLKTEANFTVPRIAQPSARRTSSMGIDAMLNETPSDQHASGYMKRSFGTANDPHPSNITSSLAASQERSNLPPPTNGNAHIGESLKSESAWPTSTQSRSQAGLDRSDSSITDRVPIVSYQATSGKMMPPSSNHENSLQPNVEPSISTEPTNQPPKKKPRLSSFAGNAPVKVEVLPQVADIKSAKSAKPPRMPMPEWAKSVLDPPGKRPGTKRNPASKGQAPARQVPAQVNGQVRVKTEEQSPPSEEESKKWEPSIINVIPQDEITKSVADFLFAQVLQNSDIGVTSLGGLSQGAVLEIEAKLGRLIDKNTNDRLRLPVLTEAILNRNSTSVNTMFETSMTIYQHRALNNFLNKALVATKQDSKSRVEMKYKHSNEIDTFFPLSQKGLLALPKSLNVSTRTSHGSKAKIRVTHDQKTGKELAKIVKTQLANIDIYSPNNEVDWRISVNVELNISGDLGDLVEMDKKEGTAGDRAKDRMSYRHQAYQIDLTQVSPYEGAANHEKTHELEIEVSAEEVRRQGEALQRGEANKYVDLISGFIDNIRTMVRQVPQDTAPPIFVPGR